MSYTLYIILISIFIPAKGLRCRIEQDTDTQEEFEDIVRSCMRQENEAQHKDRNNHMGKGYDQNDQQGKKNSSGGKHGQEDKYDKDEEEYDYNEYEDENSNEKNKNNHKGAFSQSNQKFQSYQNQDTKHQDNRKKQGSKVIGSPLESIEPCIIHCIFKQKKMLSQDNYIDKSNTMRLLTQKIHNPELKEFVEDSINECFDTLDNENKDGKCEESKRFALCLEEKGKNNCEDWDTTTNDKRGNGNGYSDTNYNIPRGSPSNRGDRGNNRHSTNTNKRDDKHGDYFSRKERGERERLKAKKENSNESMNNNYKGSNPDKDEQKIKFSDYFQSGK